MAKYKERGFVQLHQGAVIRLNENKVSYSTRWLYTHLHLLEHFCSGGNWIRKCFIIGERAKQDWFYRSIKDLSNDTGIGRRQVIEGIKKLKELNLIETWQMHFRDSETGKQSRKHLTAFRLLEIPYVKGSFKF